MGQQANLWMTAFIKFEAVWSALDIPYLFKFFKGCLPQILLGPFLNTLPQIPHQWKGDMLTSKMVAANRKNYLSNESLKALLLLAALELPANNLYEYE